MKQRIYLASPYTSPEAITRYSRYLFACDAAARLMREGNIVFSPIAHSHPLARYNLPVEFEFWREWCLSFLSSWATSLYVLTLDGWRDSKGVTCEIAEAKRLVLPVIPYDCKAVSVNE